MAEGSKQRPAEQDSRSEPDAGPKEREKTTPEPDDTIEGEGSPGLTIGGGGHA